MEKLLEMSHRYGANPAYVLAGGGNTSVKDENNLYNYNFTFNSKINISFKYNDYVTVLYPDLLNYTVIEGLFD